VPSNAGEMSQEAFRRPMVRRQALIYCSRVKQLTKQAKKTRRRRWRKPDRFASVPWLEIGSSVDRAVEEATV
jgi:hypothetical protein